MIRAPQMRAARQRFRQMAPVLDEQSRRRFVAMEALSMGHGGVSAMSRVSGLARSTIDRGIWDIRGNITAPTGRIRRPEEAVSARSSKTQAYERSEEAG